MGPRFFIDRPIFAWVVALCVILAGILSLQALPFEHYPSVATPSLTIRATYPAADAATLEPNVTQVIAQKLNGVESLRTDAHRVGTACVCMCRCRWRPKH